MAHWVNGIVNIGDDDMEYIAFGKGSKTLIILPGLGDGLRTVKGTALPFSLMYRKVGETYRVYAFSRRQNVSAGHSTAEMAEDVYRAAKNLGIEKAHILGVSQGGLIAQHLAASHPEFADRMVLAVSTDKLEDAYCGGIEGWMKMARQGDYGGIMIDTAEKSYSEIYLKKTRPMYFLLTRIGKPKSFDRFLHLAQACLDHDSREVVGQISCPVLVLGGKQDQILGAAGSVRLAQSISGAQLYLYENFGHGLYDEDKRFQQRILEFLQKECE